LKRTTITTKREVAKVIALPKTIHTADINASTMLPQQCQ